MHILVDQSGYDLLNIGDVAMLQSCVMRLQQHWPDAEIMVIAHDLNNLNSYCPGAIAIGPTLANRSSFQFLPRKPRLASEQAWKMAAPNFLGRLGSRSIVRCQPFTAIQAVQAADLVVASGGAYVTDTWWWHAVGVLSLLSLAQRLGKPTAMFGQGIGPIRQRVLRTQTRAVLPRLEVLGLREGRIGQDLALSTGIPPSVVMVTGDDSLELIDRIGAADGKALGANLRVSSYTGVDHVAAAAVSDLVLEAAAALDAPIVALPVSRYAVDADVITLRSLLRRKHNHTDIVLDDIETPEALVQATANCQAIVTCSYHAAMFGLAQGVPAVCLTKSRYYDAKFGGLQSQFPETCFVASLDVPDYASRVRALILQAWHLPAPARAAARDAAMRLRDAGREAYTQFRTVVENPMMVTADSQRSIT
jgi:polysaccharide pyruvyl transferase WcaK-like protein